MMSWRVAFLAFGILLFGVGAPALRDAADGGSTGYLVMARRRRGRHRAGDARLLVDAAAHPSGPARHRPGPVALAAAAVRGRVAHPPVPAAPPGLRRAGAGHGGDARSGAVLRHLRHGPGVPERRALRGAHRAGAGGHAAVGVGRPPARQAPRIPGVVAGVPGRCPHLLLAPVVPSGAVLAMVALCGVGYAGMQMFPLALLPDTIAVDSAASGQQRAGSFTGVWTAGETIGFAVGPALVLLMLAVTGSSRRPTAAPCSRPPPRRASCSPSPCCPPCSSRRACPSSSGSGWTR